VLRPFSHFRFVRLNYPEFRIPGIATRVDYLDLSIGRKLRTGIHETTSSSPFGEQTIVTKFARSPWEFGYIESETTAYQWIDGHDIGPRFLGNLTENDA
jgi:hypothetical protein